MTIDEAITFCNEKAINIKLKAEPKVFIQIAEWLEELKAYRAFDKTNFSDGYNMAIDDFYNALANDLIWIKERFGDDVYADLWCDVGTRAEQLKAGEENDYN